MSGDLGLVHLTFIPEQLFTTLSIACLEDPTENQAFRDAMYECVAGLF